MSGTAVVAPQFALCPRCARATFRVSGVQLPCIAGACREHTYDVTPPTGVVTTATPYFARNATLLPFRVAFSEPLLPLWTSADPRNTSVVLNRGFAANLTDAAGVSSHSASFDYVPAAGDDGLVVITFNVTDRASNALAAYNFTFVIDNTRPTVALVTTTPPYANATSLALVEARSSEPYMFFNTTSVTVVNGNAVASVLPGTDNSTGRVRLLPLADGVVVLTMVAVDRAGNVNQPSSLSFVYDTVPPTAVLTSPTPYYARRDTLQVFTAVFSEPVYAFSAAGIDVRPAGAASTLSLDASGTVATFSVQPGVDNGTMYVQFARASVTDFSLNGIVRTFGGASRTTSQPLEFVYDAVEPVLQLSSSFGAGSTVRTKAIPVVTATFSETVCCVTTETFTVRGAVVVEASVVPRTDNRTYLLVLRSGMIAGPIRVSIAAGTVRDRSGNGNVDGPARPFVFDYDVTPFPTVVVAVVSSLFLSATAIVLLTVRYQKKKAASAKVAEDSRRAMVFVNRVTDLEIDRCVLRCASRDTTLCAATKAAATATSAVTARHTMLHGDLRRPVRVCVRSLKGRHAVVRAKDQKNGVSYWTPGGWMKYSAGDQLA